MTATLAWHFCVADPTGQHVGLLRDGRPLIVGETYTHDGPLIACESGLHASICAIDALQFAPGHVACLVECSGELFEHGGDKIVCRSRRVLAAADVSAVLRRFACECALDVLPPDAPEIVRQYLTTADESIREAASWSAHEAAYRAASWSAAMAADWAAYSAAYSAAARAADWAAARAADWAAARAAQNERIESMLADALDIGGVI